MAKRLRETFRFFVSFVEGSVVSAKDAIILKKISTPSKEDLIKEIGAIALEGRKRAEKLGIKESDVPELIRGVRKSRK